MKMCKTCSEELEKVSGDEERERRGERGEVFMKCIHELSERSCSLLKSNTAHMAQGGKGQDRRSDAAQSSCTGHVL